MITEYIEQSAKRLIKKYGTQDPFALRRDMNIGVCFNDIGSLKGMYVYIKRNRYIVISSALDDVMKTTVCAHELGHDRLHMQYAKDTMLRDTVLYDMTSKPEYEANVFASSLLLTDEDLEREASGGASVFEIAATMGVDVNIVAIKALLLSKRGLSFTGIDYKMDFLR